MDYLRKLTIFEILLTKITILVHELNLSGFFEPVTYVLSHFSHFYLTLSNLLKFQIPLLTLMAFLICPKTADLHLRLST